MSTVAHGTAPVDDARDLLICRTELRQKVIALLIRDRQEFADRAHAQPCIAMS